MVAGKVPFADVVGIGVKADDADNVDVVFKNNDGLVIFVSVEELFSGMEVVGVILIKDSFWLRVEFTADTDDIISESVIKLLVVST